MARVSKSLLEKWLEAGDAGDVEAFHEVLHEDVVVLGQVIFAHIRDGKATEVWEAADVGVLLRPT